MAPADKQKMAAQLDNMAKQLEKMAQNKEGMEKTLEQAGIPKEALASKAALKKAIKKSENLTKEQKEALEKMCEGGMECQSGMQAMADAMSKMAKAGAQGEPGEGEKGAGEMAQQLSEMEALAQEMEMADAAMSECQSAMKEIGKDGDGEGMGECEGAGMGGSAGSEGTNPWSAGWNEAMGKGRGGGGLGEGGRGGEAKADFEKVKRMAIGTKGDGPIVSSKMVEGESIRGESKAAFAKAVAGADQNATEAIENNLIPRENHDAIKSYFGRLKSKAGPAPAGATPEPDAPPAEPAKDADEK
jgi:hypothetical protein